MGPRSNTEVQLTRSETVQLTPVAPMPPTPGDILAKAALNGASVEVLTKLLELQERWEATQARKAFDAALAAFKAEAPKIEKTKHVDFVAKSGNHVKYDYAPLDEACETLAAPLSKHGLSFNWTVDQTSMEFIRVTCKLRHALGHSEIVTMGSPLLDDQRMNVLQRLCATVEYLRRYTVFAILGLAAASEDTDGMTNGQAMDYISNIQTAATLDELKQRYTEAIKAAQEVKSGTAADLFMKAKDKRKKELGAV